MKRKISLALAVVAVIVSVLYPLLSYSNNAGSFIWKVLSALTVLSIIVCILSVAIYGLSVKRKNGSIFIAYDFSEVNFVQELKVLLEKRHYVCYPDISALINGSKIKDLDLSDQINRSDMLLVLLSKESCESNYISFIVKAFKKLDRPIQIYAFKDIEEIPTYLKQYMIFPLTRDKNANLSMVIRLINGLFLGKRIRENKI